MPTFDVYIQETVTYKLVITAESEKEVEDMYYAGIFEFGEEDIWEVDSDDIVRINQWKEYEEEN